MLFVVVEFVVIVVVGFLIPSSKSTLGNNILP